MHNGRIRVISLFAALIMICGTLASCSPSSEDEPEYTEGVTYTDDDGKRYDSRGFLMDDLPDDIDLGGREIRIWGSDNGSGEFFGEYSGDIISSSVYKRDLAVKSRFGVELKYDSMPTDYYNQDEYVEKAQLSVDNPYDLFASWNMCGMTLAINGYLADMGKCEYLDFSKPWWPRSLESTANINGNMYFATGDISISYYDNMFLTVMNKKLWDEYRIEGDVYEDVRNGEWTNEKMFKYAKQVYRDNNGNGKDAEDTFGYVIMSSVLLDTYTAGGKMSFIEIDGEGRFAPGGDLMSPDRIHSLLTLLIDNLWKTDNSFFDKDVETCLADGKSLFMPTLINYLGSQIAVGIEYSYAILPTPKYDVDQDHYYTNLSFLCTMYSIPLAAKDHNISALIMEAMASEGYRETTQTFYETKVKYRYSSDDSQNVEMFEIIRTHPYFEFTRFSYYNLEIKNMNPVSSFRTCVVNGNANWASKSKSLSKQIEGFCKNTLNGMFENEE